MSVQTFKLSAARSRSRNSVAPSDLLVFRSGHRQVRAGRASLRYPAIPVDSDNATLAAEQSRLPTAGNLGGGEAARGRMEHWEVGFSVADGNRLGVRPQDPVAQSRQADPLIGFFRHDGGVDHGMMERRVGRVAGS